MSKDTPKKRPGAQPTKLDEDKIRKIRKSEATQRSIAEEFGISQQHVSLIRKGKSWKWVDNETNDK